MGPIARLLLLTTGMALLPVLFFLIAGLAAPAKITADHAVEINASTDRIWQLVTDWHAIGDGMERILPGIGRRTILGGSDPVPGSIIRYPLSDGRSWDQRVLDWEPCRRYVFQNTTTPELTNTDRIVMSFGLESLPDGRTRLSCHTEVTPDGFFNRAMAQLFGKTFGALGGYQQAILEAVRHRAESSHFPASN
ncbi:MAG: SRPBCC family protein [Cyanobacteria bacterium NC_groundwater_1444_Ag_S-0.65um_54_12]|nr:SRPBCC family protein [Cyanobacteria bacterium NC_groundwater_1444_Ag_S-0.65um_54_12]